MLWNLTPSVVGLDRMKHNILRYSALILLLVGLVVVAGCSTGIKPPRKARVVEHHMEITAYCPCKQCCNWKRNWRGKAVIASGPNKGKRKKVGITASGTEARRGTIAADTNRYPFGTIIYVPGYGYGRVEDRGSAIKGEKLDLFFKDHRDANRWGRQRKTVKVYLPQ